MPESSAAYALRLRWERLRLAASESIIRFRSVGGRMMSAAYTPPVGMKSLERKLMHNGERGADYFDPEWAEVRVVMRRVTELEGALAKAMRLVHFDMLDSREYTEIKEVLNRGV